MTNYHKVVINEKVFYREFDKSTGFYNSTMHEGLNINSDQVDLVIEIDHEEIDQAISCIPSTYQKKVLQKYLVYLEMVIESLEKSTEQT